MEKEFSNYTIPIALCSEVLLFASYCSSFKLFVIFFKHSLSSAFPLHVKRDIERINSICSQLLKVIQAENCDNIVVTELTLANCR